MSADTAPRVAATEAALAELARLRAEHGPLVLFQSGGCCDGSSPMCFPTGSCCWGRTTSCSGTIGGCPFYIDAEQYERWNRPRLLLDVAPGAGTGFSLEGLARPALRRLPAPDQPSTG